jgi:DNA-binding transcriptional LysR family regulator
VREGPSNTIAEELLDFQHDICLVGTLTQPNERLKVFRIPLVEQMVFVTGSACPLVAAQNIEWKDLVQYPLILQSEGSLARKTALYQFTSRGLEPIIGAETDNVECAKDLVRQGKGIALMFFPNVKEELATGTLRTLPLTDSEIRFGIDILINKEMPPSPLIEAFLVVIKDYLNYDFLQR